MDGRFTGLLRRAVACAAMSAWVLVLPAAPAHAQSFASTITVPDPPAGFTPPRAAQCSATVQKTDIDLSTTDGAGTDPHWFVSSAVASYGPHPYHVSPAGAWYAVTNWVQPYQSNTLLMLAPIGYYTYTTWFILPCAPDSYSGLKLSGSFLADNDGAIYLNGSMLHQSGAGSANASCANHFCFLQPMQMQSSTGFVPGLNSLSVVVYNRDDQGFDPTGIAVKASVAGGCGQVCPVSYLKLCKVAGPGVVVGTPFNFRVDTGTVSVPAGPAPGGYCAAPLLQPQGATVTIAEILPPGATVTSIDAAPPGRLASSDLATGTAKVNLAGGVTEVTYTDRKPTGFLEICKKTVAQHPLSARNYAFTLTPGGPEPVVVPGNACSPAMEVPAGGVTIREVPSPDTVVTGCSTIPADRQVLCLPQAGILRVTVVPGDVSTETIATISNQTILVKENGPPKAH